MGKSPVNEIQSLDIQFEVAIKTNKDFSKDNHADMLIGSSAELFDDDQILRHTNMNIQHSSYIPYAPVSIKLEYTVCDYDKEVLANC